MAPNIFNMHTASLLNDICLTFATEELYFQGETENQKQHVSQDELPIIKNYIWFGGLICLQLIPLLSNSKK